MAGVLVLHALGLAGLLQPGAWRDREPAAAAPAPLTVRLIQRHGAEQQAPATPRPLAPTAAQRAAPSLPPRRREQAAITMPMPAAEPAPPVALAPSRAASASALDLGLPRAASAPWRARSPALDDPRGNSARAGFEERLQGAMGGDGRWVEQRIDADRVRLRRGDTCIDVKRSQAEQLDPWNQTQSPKPWLSSGPQRC